MFNFGLRERFKHVCPARSLRQERQRGTKIRGKGWQALPTIGNGWRAMALETLTSLPLEQYDSWRQSWNDEMPLGLGTPFKLLQRRCLWIKSGREERLGWAQRGSPLNNNFCNFGRGILIYLLSVEWLRTEKNLVTILGDSPLQISWDQDGRQFGDLLNLNPSKLGGQIQQPWIQQSTMKPLPFAWHDAPTRCRYRSDDYIRPN